MLCLAEKFEIANYQGDNLLNNSSFFLNLSISFVFLFQHVTSSHQMYYSYY